MDFSPAFFAKAQKHISKQNADMARLIALTGPCTIATHPEMSPYEALVRAVAHQQLHARAAEAMLGRLLLLTTNGGFPSPKALLALDADSLRACGFSVRKAATLHAIAEGAISGLVPSTDDALLMDDETLITQIATLPGIGRWTVEILLIFTLQRPDVMPADDFGIAECYKRLKGLDKAPSRKELNTLAEPWAPYRSIAAWYLWQVPKPKAESPPRKSSAKAAKKQAI
jgi:DNA-3-methyladenine glycosylase II